MKVMYVQKWFDEVLLNPMLDEEQQELKIIQLTDLIRFTESYKPSIEIIDYSHSLNVVRDENIRKGILFYDHKLLKNPLMYSSFLTKSYIEILKIQNNVHELWFVFVDDSLNAGSHDIKEFIKENNVAEIYDEVFLFDFFESQTHKLA